MTTSPAKIASWGAGVSASGRLSNPSTGNQDGIRVGEPCAYESVSGLPEWLSRDPIQEGGGLNLYGYALNNPVRYNDPVGEDVVVTDTHGNQTTYNTSEGFIAGVTAAPPGSIRDVTFLGHGGVNANNVGGFNQGIDNSLNYMNYLAVTPSNKVAIGLTDSSGDHTLGYLTNLLQDKLTPNAPINFYGCSVADPANPNNIVKVTSEQFPGHPVTGPIDDVYLYELPLIPPFFWTIVVTYRNGVIVCPAHPTGRPQ
jgi:hypothetical protein